MQKITASLFFVISLHGQKTMSSHTYSMRGCYPAIITAEASKLFATVVVQWTSGVGVRIPFPPRR